MSITSEGTQPGDSHADAAAIEPSLPTEPARTALLFHGNAAEYFRIWIVNLVLSLITLGIYSAWATVRNRRYFYGSTEFAGHRFDFHGDPVAILKGRILAVIVFMAYAFGTEFHWGITLGAFLVIAVAFPWVLVRALRFRLANSSHRGLRFGFDGTSAQAYQLLGPILLLGGGVFIWYLFVYARLDQDDYDSIVRNFLPMMASLALTVTVGLALAPVLWFRLRSFAMNHTRFGRHRFSAHLRLGVFWKALALALGLGIGATFIAGAIGFGLMSVLFFNDDPGSGTGMTGVVIATVAIYALLIPAYLVPFAAWHCITTNHVLSMTRIEGLRVHMALDPWVYWWILFSNAVIAVVTLGLAIPWAKVRMVRYKLSCLQVSGSVEDFEAGARSDPSALGDELGEVFDFDFGF
ncbi:MAG: YjgN family protein [Pseudomonadota bacterium]